MEDNKRILLGVTGGIAAYKVADLVRLCTRESHSVQVMMTDSARELIGPLTFQTLTNNPVYTDLFGLYENEIRHIELANTPSLIVIVPATANTIGKLANGIADNLLTTVVLASSVPVLIVPSMNERMYDNPAVQENLQKLKNYGYYVMDPDEGDLACGVYGKGRMPPPEDILSQITAIMLKKNDFEGIKALVTAGPTYEPMDPVRFFTNYSTGKMGFAVASALQERGAEVCLVTGPTCLNEPSNMEVVRTNTAQQMFEEVAKRYDHTDLVIKAAAVSDYRPAGVEEQKIKKDKELMVKLEKNPDILKELGARKKNQLLVGFAAETQDLRKNALEKLNSKNLDLIVANDLTEEEAGFASSQNKVTVFHQDGNTYEMPQMSKYEVAHGLLDIIFKTYFQKLPES